MSESPTIHQRVAERIDARLERPNAVRPYDRKKAVAAILEGEYGPILRESVAVIKNHVYQRSPSARERLRAELSKRGLL